LASQQQFEGPVLDELLERVRAEVGADARIVAANRVRKGGIAGFFSKQAFEVLVEPGELTPAEELARELGRRRASFIPPRHMVQGADGGPATILDLADAVSDDERNDVIDLVDDHIVSTQSRDFAQILDRFSRSIDADPEELRDTAPVAEHPAIDAFRDRATIDLPAELHAERPVERPAELPNELTIDTRRPDPLPSEPVAPLHHTVDDLIGRPLSGGIANARDRARRVARNNEVIDRYETRLSQMGLPARLIPRGAAPNELKGALVESLLRLPAAPAIPRGLGVVVVIVGANAAPVLMARDLAAELDLDPDDVVLATREHLGAGIPAWLQMNDPDTAHSRRLSWQRRERPTIVALSLPPMFQAQRWAREMLDRLEPTMTWAVVDAGWKREDIAHRVDALGGVDVLALDNLDDTVSPATALEVGIPVGRLGNEHASPLTWTELLLERLAEERAAHERQPDEQAQS
jgi:hypothetical protein